MSIYKARQQYFFHLINLFKLMSTIVCVKSNSFKFNHIVDILLNGGYSTILVMCTRLDVQTPLTKLSFAVRNVFAETTHFFAPLKFSFKTNFSCFCRYNSLYIVYPSIKNKIIWNRFISYDERKDEKDKVYTWRLLKRPLLRIFRFQASFNYFELVDEKLFHLNVILKIFFDHSSI